MLKLKDRLEFPMYIKYSFIICCILDVEVFYTNILLTLGAV